MKNTKQKIINSAITLLKQDLNCSLEEISEHANVSRRTLHRHFKGKEDLIAQIFETVGNEYIEGFLSIIWADTPPLDTLEALLRYDLGILSNHNTLYGLYKNDKYIFEEELMIKIDQEYIEIFNQIIKKEYCDQSFTPKWLGAFYDSLIELGHNQINLGIDNEECIQMIWSLFWNGINSKKR
jgi:AcrR family transcriptional regulator